MVRHTERRDNHTETRLKWDLVPEDSTVFAPIKSKRFNAKEVWVGGFFLTQDQKGMLENRVEVAIDPQAQNFLRDKFGQQVQLSGHEAYIYHTSPEEENSFKMCYFRIPCGPITIMSGQKIPTFYPYLICDPS